MRSIRLIFVLLCFIININIINAKMDPYTGEEIADEYEYSYEGYEGYEYYSEDGEGGYDDNNIEEEEEEEEVERVPPGYLPPLKPTVLSLMRKMLSKKFISTVGELYQCLPQSEMSSTNVIDIKKAPVTSEQPEVQEEEIKDPNKKLNFREMQEEKVRIAREKMKLEAIIIRHRLGAGCERMICESCRVLVEEFANRVIAHIDNSTVQYIRDLATFDFCHSKELTFKYRPVVNHVCVDQMINVSSFRDALVLPFEEDNNWANVNSVASMAVKRKKICLVVGACDEEHFQMQIKPLNKYQEHWDDRCYVCQAFARNLEDRLSISMHVTESTVIPITAQTCDRLNLAAPYDAICRELVVGKLLDDIAWLAKIHGEKIEKKTVSNILFADSLCEEIKFCSKYIDPEKAQIQEEVVPVFF